MTCGMDDITPDHMDDITPDHSNISAIELQQHGAHQITQYCVLHVCV